LLAEVKDIHDELNMIVKVLGDQNVVHRSLETSVTGIYKEEYKSQKALRHRFEEMSNMIETHIRDLDRMKAQAERIYKSITDLLDLKQKHANAFEARFARDQAAGTARQSQTIMVFTIVTIIFLPLSFIASMFTINIQEFPHKPGGDQPSFPITYVSKFMFAIGLSISIPAIAIALSFDAIGDFFREVRSRYRKHRNRPRPRRDSASKLSNGDDKTDVGHPLDTHPFDQTFSIGRSTMRQTGRRSLESYVSRAYGGGGGSLLPVTSRSTIRSDRKGDVRAMNGMTKVNGRLSVEVHSPVERISTGFKMRGSGDVERGG
jgi:hypothetical protein